MDYGNWNLRNWEKGNARISVIKAQLVERLEEYDRNKDLNKTDEVYVAYEMTTPDKVQYKYINGNVLFPAIQGKSFTR